MARYDFTFIVPDQAFLRENKKSKMQTLTEDAYDDNDTWEFEESDFLAWSFIQGITKLVTESNDVDKAQILISLSPESFSLSDELIAIELV